MAQDWITVITDAKAAAKFAEAQSAERTAGITAQCKTAFTALENFMRDMKKRYFLKPPLGDSDFVDLLLPVKDETHSPVPAPVNQAGIEINKWAPHTLGFRRFTATDLGGGASDYGVRVYYALTEPGAVATGGKPQATRLTADVYILSVPPQSPADLPNSFFTRRYKDLLELPPESSGKTCYMAARFENSKGESGPWGTMISAIIP
jgi:hypothetical protein